jgi:hypothetical protein
MQQGTACDFGLPGVPVTNVNWPFAKSKLEHQEERVRNRYRRFNICIAFALASALSMLAQSDHTDVQRRDNFQLQGDPSQSLLTAKLIDYPVIGSISNESELPDAPSAAKSDTSTGDAASPSTIKKESQGAPVAAQGGPLWVDRSVADRNYFMVTGAMFSASVVNAELTMHCLDRHASCNDVPNTLSRRMALYGIGIPADLGVAYLTYYMKRKHSHIWYVPAACVTAANLFFGYRAYHWSQEHTRP